MAKSYGWPTILRLGQGESVPDNGVETDLLIDENQDLYAVLTNGTPKKILNETYSGGTGGGTVNTNVLMENVKFNGVRLKMDVDLVFAANSFTAIPWKDADFNAAATYFNSTDITKNKQIKLTKSGYYSLSITVCFEDQQDGQRFISYRYIPNTGLTETVNLVSHSTISKGNCIISVSSIVKANANSILEILVKYTSISSIKLLKSDTFVIVSYIGKN